MHKKMGHTVLFMQISDFTSMATVVTSTGWNPSKFTLTINLIGHMVNHKDFCEVSNCLQICIITPFNSILSFWHIFPLPDKSSATNFATKATLHILDLAT